MKPFPHDVKVFMSHPVSLHVRRGFLCTCGSSASSRRAAWVRLDLRVPLKECQLRRKMLLERNSEEQVYHNDNKRRRTMGAQNRDCKSSQTYLRDIIISRVRRRLNTCKQHFCKTRHPERARLHFNLIPLRHGLFLSSGL